MHLDFGDDPQAYKTSVRQRRRRLKGEKAERTVGSAAPVAYTSGLVVAPG